MKNFCNGVLMTILIILLGYGGCCFYINWPHSYEYKVFDGPYGIVIQEDYIQSGLPKQNRYLAEKWTTICKGREHEYFAFVDFKTKKTFHELPNNNNNRFYTELISSHKSLQMLNTYTKQDFDEWKSSK